MKLTIGNFYIKDIVWGETTAFHNGTLTVNAEEAIMALNPDGALANVKLHIVHPGEPVRILPVKEIVEPRIRPDGRATFPGYTGPLELSGEGTVYALKNMAVTAVGKYGSVTDGMLDMSGPAAELTHYAKLIHLCFTASNANRDEENSETYKKNTNYRKGAHLLAEYIAQAVLTKQPENWECYDISPDVSPSLPRVGLILQITTSWIREPGHNSLLYGEDTMHLVPTLLHPNEILDGALCSDSLMYSSFKQYTYDYQNAPILKLLCSEHGKSINFAGVYLDVNDTTEKMKQRASERIAVLARLTQLDAAISVALSNGHSEVDFFKTLSLLEQNGVKCVGMCMESPGHYDNPHSKVLMDATADALISTGSDHTILELPPLEHIIGDLNSIGRDAYPGAWAYDIDLGPSLREDGSLIVDAMMICGQDGTLGWSNKICKDF